MSSTRADRGYFGSGQAASMHGYARRQSAEGLARDTACWAAGQIENRPTPVNGCPQDDPATEQRKAAVIVDHILR
jgi:hypothetical protein